MKEDPKKCLVPCKGLYSDVYKDTDFQKVEEMKNFENILASYENYKKGQLKDIEYPEEILSNIKTIYVLYNSKYLFRL